MISDEQNMVLASLIESRFGLKPREARLMADNIREMGIEILKGTKPQKTLEKVRVFVDQYRNDLSILEQKRVARARSAGKSKKKKIQLDIFGNERHE